MALLVVVFAVVNFTVLYLRRDPVDHDHFHVPSVLPVLGIAVSIALLTQIEAETHETGQASIGVVCQLRDRKHLDKLLAEVRAISGVLRVGRRNSGGAGTQLEALS